VQLAIRRQRAALPAPDPLRQIPDLLRPCIAALIYAFAFASLARGSEESGGSLLDQLLRTLSRRGINLPGSSGRGSDPEAPYRRQLQDNDQP
jgi:hypothetical protein